MTLTNHVGAGSLPEYGLASRSEAQEFGKHLNLISPRLMHALPAHAILNGIALPPGNLKLVHRYTEQTNTKMFSFRTVYATVAVLASVVLLWFSLMEEPAPPIARGTNLPEQRVYDEMHMDNASYAAWTEKADELWEALLPENDGNVLATNLTSGYHFWGRVSMFHQLQCLRDIRKQLEAMSRSWDASKHFMRNRGYGSDYEQMGLCFDYLRQGILCHADTTLNPVAFNDEWDDGKVVDGNILWHKCKDREILYNWADMSGRPREVRFPVTFADSTRI